MVSFENDPDLTCRTCLSRYKSNDLVSIFCNVPVDDENLTYSYMLDFFTCTEVRQEDGLPTKICKLCANNIKSCYLFKKKCEKNYVLMVQQIRYENQVKDKCYFVKDTTVLPNDIIKTEKDEVLFTCKCGESFFNEDAYNDHEINHWDKKEYIKVKIKEEPIDDEYEAFQMVSLENKVQDNQKSAVSDDEVFDSGHSSSSMTSAINDATNTNTAIVIPIQNNQEEVDSGNNELFENEMEVDDHHDNEDLDILQPESDSYPCSVCQKVFQNEKYLKRHMIIHCGTHKCIFCKKVYMEFRNLTAHISAKHAEENIRFQAKRLKQVRVDLENISIPQCKICDKTFWCEAALKKHEIDSHTTEDLETAFEEAPLLSEICINKPKEPPHNSADVEKNFKCRFCSAAYTTKKSLKYHRTTKHGNELHSESESEQEVMPKQSEIACPHCEEKFATLRGFKYHFSTRHSTEDPVPTTQSQTVQKPTPPQQKKLLPPTTGELYTVIDEVNNLVKCKFCEKVIGRKAFKNHYNLHTSSKHKCDFCTWDFPRSDYLKSHMKSHHPKELICVHCNIQIRNKNLYEAHIKTHALDPALDSKDELEEIPAKKLRSCGPAEIVEGLLLESKSNQQPHHCKICSRDFSTVQAYNRHVSCKHPETPDPPEEDTLSSHPEIEFIIPDDLDLPKIKEEKVSPVKRGKVSNAILCEICRRKYYSLEKYYIHLKYKHNRIPIESIQESTPQQNSTPSVASTSTSTSRATTPDVVASTSKTKSPPKPMIEETLEIPSTIMFTCDICPIIKKRRDYLKVHVKQDHQGEYFCTICELQFSNFHNFLGHSKTEHKDSEIYKTTNQCKKCLIMFKSPEILQEHQQYKHGKNVKAYEGSSCYICNTRFPNNFNLDIHFSHGRHKTLTTVVEEFEEEYEKIKSGSAKEQKLKMSTGKSAEKPKLNKSEPPKKPQEDSKVQKRPLTKTYNNQQYFISTPTLNQCKICQKICNNTGNLYRHLKVHSEIHIYQCPYCEKGYIVDASLKKHIKLGHPNEEKIVVDEDPPNKKLKVSTPEQKFTGDTFMKYVSKTKDKLLKCKICNKTYETMQSLIRHLLTHEQVDYLTCSLCDSKYINEDYLYRHQRLMHKVDKREEQKEEAAEIPEKQPEMEVDESNSDLTCKLCNKTVKLMYHLKFHIERGHVNDNPSNMCCYCGRTFARPGYLSIHLSTHNPTKSLKCHVCNLFYYTTTGLKKHNMKWHADDNPERELPNHQQSHYQQISKKKIEEEDVKLKFFKCKQCDQIFMKPEHLHLHEKFRHEKPLEVKSEPKKAVKTSSPVKPSQPAPKPKQKTPPPQPVPPIQPTPEELTCDLCLKEFRSLMILQQHKETHKQQELNFPCDRCSLRFKNQKFLKNHKKFFCYWSKSKENKSASMNPDESNTSFAECIKNESNIKKEDITIPMQGVVVTTMEIDSSSVEVDTTMEVDSTLETTQISQTDTSTCGISMNESLDTTSFSKNVETSVDQSSFETSNLEESKLLDESATTHNSSGKLDNSTLQLELFEKSILNESQQANEWQVCSEVYDETHDHDGTEKQFEIIKEDQNLKMSVNIENSSGNSSVTSENNGNLKDFDKLEKMVSKIVETIDSETLQPSYSHSSKKTLQANEILDKTKNFKVPELLDFNSPQKHSTSINDYQENFLENSDEIDRMSEAESDSSDVRIMDEHFEFVTKIENHLPIQIKIEKTDENSKNKDAKSSENVVKNSTFSIKFPGSAGKLDSADKNGPQINHLDNFSKVSNEQQTVQCNSAFEKFPDLKNDEQTIKLDKMMKEMFSKFDNVSESVDHLGESSMKFEFA